MFDACAVGRARRAAAQHVSDSPRSECKLARQEGLGNLHRCVACSIVCSKTAHYLCLARFWRPLEHALTVLPASAVADKVISTISAERSGVVFLLWGKPAQTKVRMLTSTGGHARIDISAIGCSMCNLCAPFTRARVAPVPDFQLLLRRRL